MFNPRTHLICSFLTATLILYALVKHTGSYVIVLRWAVLAAALYGSIAFVLFHEWYWSAIMIFPGILFNPIIPLQLSRSASQVLYAAASIFFIASAFRYSANHPRSMSELAEENQRGFVSTLAGIIAVVVALYYFVADTESNPVACILLGLTVWGILSILLHGLCQIALWRDTRGNFSAGLGNVSLAVVTSALLVGVLYGVSLLIDYLPRLLAG